MNRPDISELHFISPIENLTSILEYGILSNRRAAQLDHRSVAMEEVQDRRRNKRIPGAGLLHDYANLYFDVHNPMLSKRRDQNDTICVLRVDAAVLDQPGVIIADRNAASGCVPRERGDEPEQAFLWVDTDGCSPRARVKKTVVKKTVAGTVCFRENLVECGVLELAASRARCLLA